MKDDPEDTEYEHISKQDFSENNNENQTDEQILNDSHQQKQKIGTVRGQNKSFLLLSYFFKYDPDITGHQ